MEPQPQHQRNNQVATNVGAEPPAFESSLSTGFPLETIATANPIREIVRLVKPEAIAALKEASLSKDFDGDDSFAIRLLTKQGPSGTSVLVFFGESHITSDAELLLIEKVLEHFPQRAVEGSVPDKYLFGEKYMNHLTKLREDLCEAKGLQNRGAIHLGITLENLRGDRLESVIEYLDNELQSTDLVEINLEQFQLDESDLKELSIYYQKLPRNHQFSEDQQLPIDRIPFRETVHLEENFEPTILEQFDTVNKYIGFKVGSFIISDSALNTAGGCFLVSGIAMALNFLTNIPYTLPIAQFTGYPALAYAGFVAFRILLNEIGVIDLVARPIDAIFQKYKNQGREAAMTECIRELDRQDNLKWPRLIQTGKGHTDSIIERLMAQDNWQLVELKDLPDGVS